MRPSTRGPVLLLLTALLGLVAGVLPASAHSRLLSITPQDGASVPASPAEVVLTFNETVNPQFVTVRVTDGEGTVVAGDDARAEGSRVVAPVPEPLSAGPYKVTYRVVSADSHPISGSTTFTVGGDPQASPTAASPSASATPSATPDTSTSAPGPTPTDAADEAASESAESGSGGTPPLVWVLLGAGVLAALAGAAHAVRRDRDAA